VMPVPTTDPPFNAYSISSLGDQVALGGVDGTVVLSRFGRDTRASECPAATGLQILDRPPNFIAWSPYASLVAFGSSSGALCLVDGDSGALLEVFHGHTGPIYSVSFSPDGRLIATASIDGSLRFWGIPE
jgi:WD40 repeat protein